ncbi:uncharacterized protein LOC127724024, partial [Mytilus californianus]|uniref:uncharacterized protein LOC127724024 n=1 Tax=Mytilus californianus TaxID=6549 RepID=UPI00224831BF
MRNSMFISPLSFMQSLLTYCITGSKAAVVLNSIGHPSGSYTTVNNWIKEYSKEALQCPNDVDVVTFFDNNQVLQRKWRVISDFKSESSVITNLIHVLPNPNSMLQLEDKFSPKHWFKYDEASKDKAVSDILTLFQQEDVAFCKFRNQFIDEQLKIVCDLLTAHEDRNVGESSCAGSMDPHDRYNFVRSEHPADKIKVVMGDPCFENPV